MVKYSTKLLNSQAAVTVLTVGHVTHDRYGERILPGGGAFYAAQTARFLGARSLLVTAFGSDFECKGALEGLEVTCETGPHTTTFKNVYPEHGSRVQWVEGVAPPVTPALLPPSSRRADVLFLAPTFGEVDPRLWLEAVRAKIVGIALQGLLRQAEAGPSFEARKVMALRDELAPELYEGAHVVFASEEDLRQLGSDRVVPALIDRVPTVVLTCGEAGSRILTKGGEERVGIFPAHTKDPTGAGDTYAAAFLFALAQGASAPDAARLGAAAASIAVEGEGGECLPRMSESYERADRVSVITPTLPVPARVEP